MEDYIFLILAIVLSIFGAITKKNKKDRENILQEKTEKPGNFFMDQFLNDDFTEEDDELEVQPQIKAVVEKKEAVRSVPQVSVFAQYRPEFKSSLPGRLQKNIRPGIQKPEVEPEGAEDETEEGTGYLEDFSLRKAFVYSEIMNTKY
jgi:hypothetical protein